MPELTKEALTTIEARLAWGEPLVTISSADAAALVAEVRSLRQRETQWEAVNDAAVTEGLLSVGKTLIDKGAEIARLRGLLEGWPDKLTTTADWLDLLDAALGKLAATTQGELRQRWSEALDGTDHDEIQRDLREFANALKRELAGEAGEGSG